MTDILCFKLEVWGLAGSEGVMTMTMAMELHYLVI